MQSVSAYAPQDSPSAQKPEISQRRSRLILKSRCTLHAISYPCALTIHPDKKAEFLTAAFRRSIQKKYIRSPRMEIFCILCGINLARC